jgi:hypothetical protein
MIWKGPEVRGVNGKSWPLNDFHEVVGELYPCDEGGPSRSQVSLTTMLKCVDASTIRWVQPVEWRGKRVL